jgi:amino acid adenylation domain-containing protein
MSAEELEKKTGNLSAAKQQLLKKLLRSAETTPNSADKIARRPEQPHYPLSFAQQRLWFLHQLDPQLPFYTIVRAFRLTGVLDSDALRQSFEAIMNRHEILRATFHDQGGSVVQIIADQIELPFFSSDLSGLAFGERQAAVDKAISDEFHKTFDLCARPPIRCSLLRLEERVHMLVVAIHHIVIDDWSMGIFFREMSGFYNAFCCKQSPALPELPIQYVDFASWQQNTLSGRNFDSQFAYWKQKLAGSTSALNLPIRNAADNRSFAAANISAPLSSSLVRQIKAVCGNERCTPFVFLLAMCEILLARYTGKEDIAIGTVVSGRDRKELESLVGFLTNTVVIRERLALHRSFKQALRQTRETVLGAQQNKDVPFEHLVQVLQPERRNAHAPFFQVMFFLQQTHEGRLSLSCLQTQVVPVSNRTTAFDLSFAPEETAQGINIAIHYKTGLFDANIVCRMLRDYQTLLEHAAEDLEQSCADVSLLTFQEMEQLRAWNDTARPYAREETIVDLFQEQVVRTPNEVAVQFGNVRLTYRQFNERANQLARFLVKLGMGPEVLAGIFMERSPEMLVALLGVLKAGGAYVPLDSAYPLDRLQFMASDSAFRLLLTQQDLPSQLQLEEVSVIQVNSEWQEFAGEDVADLPGRATSENAAYVIYTSGSSGKPKGVVASHRGIYNQLLWLMSEFPLNTCDRVVQKTSISFDAAVAEILLPLVTGARLVLANPGGEQDVNYLIKLIQEEKITFADLPPVLLRAMLEHGEIGGCSSLKWVLCGGEVLPPEIVEQLGRTSEAYLYNLYGPTETTVQSTFYRCCRADSQRSVPIGRPIANTQIYLMGNQMELMPKGVVGELYIGGDGVARGYLGRPDLTAERFLPDSYSGRLGARLYHTGDLARWTEDGDLEFASRTDSQIKIRGFRIETGEIESALHGHPRVKQAAVVATEDELKEKRLIAYIVKADGQPVNISELRADVKSKLPEYMVPSQFVFIDQLPLTSSGKLNRRLLPAPQWQGETYRAPRNPTEEMLCEIFSEVLSVERVGIEDDFFALGGHSLLATRLVSRIRAALGVELPLRKLFDSPAVVELAALLQKTERSFAPLIPQPRPARLPLSYAQQRLWFIDQMEGTSTEYNMPEALRLRGKLDLNALEHAVRAMVKRHESLRTHFAEVDGEPVQVIAPELNIDIPVEDLTIFDGASRQAYIAAAMRQEWEAPFNLSRGPVLRLKLFKLGEQEHVLIRTFHHIVSDGWSQGVFTREFGVLYGAFREGRNGPLPPLSIQYADFTLWQRRWLNDNVLARHLAYWKEQLAGIPVELVLPKDRPRQARQTFAARRIHAALSLEQTVALRRLGHQNHATLYMTLLSAFAVLLHRYSGQDDIIIGSPIANRQEAQLEQLIGFFVNSLVIRARVNPEITFQELLAQVRVTTLDAYAHQDLPFERLVAELSPQRTLNVTPIYQVAFAFQNAPMEMQQLKDLEIELLRTDELRVRFDLELHAFEAQGILQLQWIYNKDLFDCWRVEQLARNYVRLLDALASSPDIPVLEISILDAEERRVLLEDFNGPLHHVLESPLPVGFARQAMQMPEAVAVLCGLQRLTYRELDERANQLACFLQKRGAGPEKVIGICVQRSVEMVVALVAVLKAGAAYVPLDPGYPVERLKYLAKDSALTFVLTMTGQLPLVSQICTEAVLLDHEEWIDESVSQPELEISPRYLAYVIYTSGSTGRPKGVMVSHHNLLHSTVARSHVYKGSVGRFLLLPSFAFDSSVAGLFWTLNQGGALHLPEEDKHRDVYAIVEQIHEDKITHLLCLPSLYLQIMEAGGREKLESLRTVIVAGESCPPELVRFHEEMLPGTDLHNEYGPTEGTVWSTVYCHHRGDRCDRVPIGSPIPNTRIYILDKYMELLPVGVPGELFIGGDGLARGYLNRAELTAEKFVPDPFSPVHGERLYRTGDLGSRRPDGQIDFLGRNDYQIKIRGHRIELGEIEAALKNHERVQDALVKVGDQENLLGYVVLRHKDEDQTRMQLVQLEQWQQLYESTYHDGAASEGDFNIVGWKSSYTGKPIPDHEMRIWVEETVARIQALHPVRVLEIGCGTGLLLTRLAADCKSYVGVDFSREVIQQLENYLSQREDLRHVLLRQGLAHELSFAPDNSFDMVVLNSVVQYFPSVDYLMQVLMEAVRVTCSGGHIFVGDVRNLLLQDAYYASVQLHKAPPGTPLEDLRQGVAHARHNEKELLVDPALFQELVHRWKKPGRVEMSLKPGAYDNELSCFRYNVLLSMSAKQTEMTPQCWLSWDKAGVWRKELERLLTSQPDREIGLRSFQDRRVAKSIDAVRLLQDSSGALLTATQLQEAIAEVHGEGPHQVAQLAQRLGVGFSWQHFGADGIYDIIFNPQYQEITGRQEKPFSYYRRFGNAPAQNMLIKQLEQGLQKYLRESLPAYMVPSAIVALPSWPLTANGKVDRAALPMPDRHNAEYSPPETTIEEGLAQIWAGILGQARVGIDDNFFDLGGHSLLVAKVRMKIRDKLNCDIPIIDFFTYPTIRALAQSLGQVKQNIPVAESQSRAAAQKQYLLRRVRTVRRPEVSKERVQ